MNKIIAIENARIARCDADWQGQLDNYTILIQSGKILWFGESLQVPQKYIANIHQRVDMNHKIITPGFIDCHTHLVYGGHRASEYGQRLQGISYAEIAQNGGGILSTVKSTRASDVQTLFDSASLRLQHWLKSGFTTIEIKSGYGLDKKNELKMLQVIAYLDKKFPIRMSPTLLAAHTLPPEFKNRPDDYINWIIDDLIPDVVRLNLAKSVDVFCEKIGFSLSQSKKLLENARASGLQIKIHAEQLSDSKGAKMAAELGAQSADHLEYLDESAIKAMQKSQTVAVLLPVAYYFLRENHVPPIELLRQYQIPIAIASDSNPGSAPITSPLLTLNMASTFFKLTHVEVIKGVTLNAAKALKLDHLTGSIEIGKEADLAIWDINDLEELCYWIGNNPCYGRYVSGEFFKN